MADVDDRYLSKVAFDRLHTKNTLSFVADGVELINDLKSRLDSKEDLPDLILLDINMPRKNGLEALKEIIEDEKLKHLRVILFTTSQLEKDKTDVMRIGADGLMVKPANLNGLIEVFRKICEQPL